MTATLRVTACPLCGNTDADDSGNCAGCGAPARTRSLAPVLDEIVHSELSRASVRALPLLAFAMTGAERQLLERVFSSFVSASLYGDYGPDHETGVDVRDLSRYPGGMASGVFSILLFDYVVELEQALAECSRVLAPGGVFFTHIADYRLVDGSDPPLHNKTIKQRPGYFDYVPADKALPSILVGRDWVPEALQRAGLDSRRVVVHDQPSDARLDWFIGTKLPSTTRVGRPRPRRTDPSPLTKTYSTLVDPAFGFGRVLVELSVPTLPGGGNADFAEHVTGTDTVIAAKQGGVLISDDLGESWRFRPTPEAGETRLIQSFTTAEGFHLVQGDAEGEAPIFVFDPDWRFLGSSCPGLSPWHGSRSIGESDGAIVWGEYPDNAKKYAEDVAELGEGWEREGILRPSRLFRSTDNGLTWETVLEQSWRDIRHFHTVVADPYEPGRWWASSGDRAPESRVWESLDNGQTWRDVTNTSPEVRLHPSLEDRAQNVFRYTDLLVREDDVIWGTDDWLGRLDEFHDPGAPVDRRVGSRLFHARKEHPWIPEPLAYVGNPVRSIVDAGPAYVAITEAKHPRTGLGCPQVLLISASSPSLVVPLFSVDNHRARPTGMTYSRASQRAKDGVFFTYRSPYDAFPRGPRLLRWRISFED